MATAVLTTDLVEITDCDSTTAGGAWSGISATSDTSDPTPLEGTGWVGGVIKQADDDNSMTFTPTSSINMAGKHLRCPVQTILKSNLKTKALGGIQVIITGSTSGTATFNVSGTDFYTGGWEMLVCNPYASPDEGTQVVGNVTSIKFNFKIVTAAKNIVTTNFDWMSYGTGFYVSGGTNGDEIGMSHIDVQDVYYLLCEERKGVYRISGKFQIGDSTGTATTYFKDSGKIIIFENLDVDADFYEFNIAGNGTGTTVVDLTGNFITADGGKVYSVDFTDSTNVTSITLDGAIFQNASTIDLSSVVSGAGTVFDVCGAIDPGGATLSGCTIKNSTATGTTTGSLVVNVDTEAEACTDMSFLRYTGATTYAVYVASGVTEFDMDNWIFDDPDNTTSYALYWAGTGGTLTINSLNGTNLVNAGCTSAGGTVNVVANPVALTVTCQTALGAKIENVMVLVEVGDGTNFPYQDSVSIARSTTTATVTHTAHGLETGDLVVIKHCTTVPHLNGVKTITYIGVNSYSFTCEDTGGASDTGGDATFAIISGLTSSLGVISESRTYAADQLITGRARKSTTAPYYVTAPITGTINKDSGLSITVQMTPDE